MKNILIATVLFLFTISVNATEKDGRSNDTESAATTILSGTIADEFSGESLAGVEVKIEGTELKTYSDFDGNFTFKNVKSGDYKLTTNYISYKKNSQSFKVSPTSNEVKIKLQTSN